MDRKTDRRTALKVLTAGPLGLAVSAALAGDAYAQMRGTEIRPVAMTGPVEPNAGSWKTWLLSSGSELRIAPPPSNEASDPSYRRTRRPAPVRSPERRVGARGLQRCGPGPSPGGFGNDGG